jgi:hypothetical protein
MAEATRLEQKAKPFEKIAIAAENGTLDPDTPDGVLDAAIKGLRQAAEAVAKAARLGA